MYDRIIQEQRANVVIDKTEVEEVNEKVLYLPQRPVIRESAETRKIKILYDASAKMSLKVTDSGPPIMQASTCLKNLLFSLKVHSVASFINNLLKISFEQIGVNFVWTLVCSVI